MKSAKQRPTTEETHTHKKTYRQFYLFLISFRSVIARQLSRLRECCLNDIPKWNWFWWKVCKCRFHLTRRSIPNRPHSFVVYFYHFQYKSLSLNWQSTSKHMLSLYIGHFYLCGEVSSISYSSDSVFLSVLPNTQQQHFEWLHCHFEILCLYYRWM